MIKKVSIPKLHRIKFKSGAHAENVVFPDEFDAATDIPVINVLEGAALAGLERVALIGYDENGVEYLASSVRRPEEAAYMLERGKYMIMRIIDSE